ncbi:MAG: 2-C-methyl-D-erythritol 4-phosphate cytidylyltransferase [Ktedonobacteraceae bacterium]|nr:2-C-methyl-D-erythritol 4-phosphate cytidylyltransferase [Ktedonobacteraceae bacterium]
MEKVPPPFEHFMQEKAAVVIVAAGSSKRMQGRDKLWLPLAGRISLAYTLDVFQHSPIIDTIILVVNSERLDDAEALCKHEDWSRVAAIVAGGARRQDSVRIGLDTLASKNPDCRWVMIHDGARPFITEELLATGLQAVQEHQAVVAAVPVKDTIKQVQNGRIYATLDRAQLWMVQTPQIFSFPLILQAHSSPLAQEDVTDDATLLERMGHHVAVFPGSYTNIKITTQEDLLFAEALLQGHTER